MGDDTAAFYNDLAEQYHLLYEDWDRAIDRQASILGPLLETRVGSAPLRVLDCASGIGTQAIGLAARGHAVTASDLSASAVRRAQREAKQRELALEFHVADMRDLSLLPQSRFDAVVAGDNALPHLLSGEDLGKALSSIFQVLRPGGLLLATIRDYDRLLQAKPELQAPAFYTDAGRRRIVHQVWDWEKDEYELHLYLTRETGFGWESRHYASRYRALQRRELSHRLTSSGFEQIEWLMPEVTGFYQPIVIARRGDAFPGIGG